jgi:hypothetical protein
MDNRAERYIKTYFDSFNQGDEEAHLAQMREGAEYFGSGTQVIAMDVLTARRIYRSTREIFGVRRIEPLATFGEFPRFAVRALIHGNRGPGHVAEVVFVFHLDEQGQLISLWALWNPAPFLGYQP